ncbi:molybdate-anion transporter isoform X2 [Phalaenopsis equestris]|uniref:molybdate-anion transporter isoform X2 n=1 Tax=Phalaenopsis equestris TaxID=78828 RepID=UPI0009E604A7|nr:molybdate-anion transporter isoform X2 [Phalaenopsis equestris]
MGAEPPYLWLHFRLLLLLRVSLSLLRGGGAARTTTTASGLFDVGPTTPFLRFQRSFLLLYSFASVMEGLESMYGEYEFAYHGMSGEQMVLITSAGVAVSLVFGTFVGFLSDIIGPRIFCILFCFFHLLVGVLKSVAWHPSMLLSSLCMGIASTIYSICFETWMVTEHEKQGHKINLLSDTFWLMTLFESASLLGSQGLANLLIKGLERGLLLPSALAALLAIISIHYLRKEWNGNYQNATIENYQKSFTVRIFADKSIWMLGWAQASVHFSLSVFWILWAPTIVEDGREVQLSHIYPCFLGSRMLGSTTFPWFSGAASPLHNEDQTHLIAAFAVAGLVLSIIAYDYQDIGVLVVLFCIFHACIGLISPSLARLRTMYIPNELRGGMVSASLVPANAAYLFVLVIGGYYRSLNNAAIMAFAAVGLLSAAGCIYVLRWRKHPRQNWHDL